ncbi:glutathione ABC transporter substrate-binding protein [Virgibacillus sp. L01]|uniref:glutathione ABC transporter substrate-binding protein n=1 Tax=Virgibacillus sp. L01 TaxID=3457429 RepID=UPI003FD3CB62
MALSAKGIGKRRSKANYFSMVILVLLILFVQACSTGAQDSSEDETEEGTAGSNGGTLKIARSSDATSLDPHFVTNISTANILYQKVYETLVVPDMDMNIKPNLAKEWEQLDELTWEFTLEEGVTFHDGAPFNAEAVKKTFDRLLDPETASPQADKLGMVEEIKVIDEYTVQFILSEPYAPLLSILAANEGSIISPELIEESPEEIASNPVGTGPFKFDHWESGDEILLVENENYWGKKPNINNVEYQIVPEDSTRIAMVETGEAHISDQVPVTEVNRIENSSALKLERTDGLGTEFIGFNTQKAPFDNVLVRKAISHAIERESIISGVFNNVGKLATSTMSAKVSGYTELDPYEYDTNKAKELLIEAGYPDGFEMTILTADIKERISLAEVVQSQLKGIGVDVNVQVLEYGAYIAATDKGEGHMFNGSWGNATGDGDYNQYNLFHTNSIGPSGNFFFYSNKEVDELIEEGRKEQNPEKREELYKKSQQIEMEEAVYVPIRVVEHLAVYNKDKIEGLRLNPVSYLMLDDVKILE